MLPSLIFFLCLWH